MPYKVYKSKHITEIIEYKQMIISREITPREDQEINPVVLEEVKEKNREYYRKTQKLQLRRDIIENFDNESYFATLTFKEEITEIKEGHTYINKYITNLRKKDKELKYLAIPEYHKNGRIHYHCIIHSTIHSKTILDKKWLYGISQVKKIDSVDNLGAYITKYISKDIDEMEGRIILKSRNLKKVEPILLHEFPLELSKSVYTKSWQDYFGNTVTYYQYNEKRL